MDGAALLVIDMQTGFDDASWGRRNNPDAELHAMRLIRHWRSGGGQIVHVRHDSSCRSSPLARDRHGNAFKPGFEPLEGEWLVAKRVHSAFIGTDLAPRLRAAGIESVTICGLTTDQCVSTTARMACDLGFETIVAEDACVCFDQSSVDGVTIAAETIHLAHITTLHSEFARVARVEELLAEQPKAASRKGRDVRLESAPTIERPSDGRRKKFGML